MTQEEVFLDTNILIDVLLNRPAFVGDSESLVTRNTSDFASGGGPVLTPSPFLQRFPLPTAP